MIIILWWFRLILYTGRHLTSGPVRDLYNMSNYQTTVNLIDFYQKEVAREWVKWTQAFILIKRLTRSFLFFLQLIDFLKKKLIYIKLKYFNKNCKITSYSSIPVCLLSEKYQQKNDIDMLFPILILTTNITGQIWNLKIITCA